MLDTRLDLERHAGVPEAANHAVADADPAVPGIDVDSAPGAGRRTGDARTGTETVYGTFQGETVEVDAHVAGVHQDRGRVRVGDLEVTGQDVAARVRDPDRKPRWVAGKAAGVLGTGLVDLQHPVSRDCVSGKPEAESCHHQAGESCREE